MQAALTSTQAPPPTRRGVWQTKITGGFRRITVHQLVMAAWLYRDKHITKRQLRVYFAAHEMHQRREYTQTDPGTDRPRKPLYGLDEIKALIGGRDSKTADAALSGDVKALGRLGLVKVTSHAIDFAVSIDQIALDDVTGFWSMFDEVRNQRRTIPMPRRTCRAMAAGFRPAMMMTMIALMIRSLYWHRRGDMAEQGAYRVDGSTKRSWIAHAFNISERAVTDARATLIELGWLMSDEEQPQWHMNQYGARGAINVDAFGPQLTGQSSSPTPDNTGQSSSPYLNSSPSPKGEDLNTRRPAPMRSGPTGVSFETKMGSRKGKTGGGPPNLRDITDKDLRDTDRLLELHRQAIALGVPVVGEAGRLDFLALAERARACGSNPPKLFAWLLKHRRFDFIAIANEEAAALRLREIHNGPRQQGRGDKPTVRTPKPRPVELSEDDKVVVACIQTAQKHRGVEPFTLARQVKGWTRDRWDMAQTAFDQRRLARLNPPERSGDMECMD